MKVSPVFYALASAMLFGISTPVAKALLGELHPFVLAGLLYCGAGLGIALLRVLLQRAGYIAQAPLAAHDFPWLAGAITAGGTVGPLLLMYGLSRTDASSASLLLTLEGVATALIAWFVFHENVDRRVALGMVFIVGGAVILAWSGTPSWGELEGPLAIAGAGIAWGIDNNLTRKVALSDPLQIVEWKGLVAGPANLALGLLAGGTLPTSGMVSMAAMAGFIGYGISLAFFVVALRHLGAARTGAYFSTAPFFGTLVAVMAFAEPITLQLVTGGICISIGVWLHLSEHHAHEHVHEVMEHNHRHTHDEHHRHLHTRVDPPGEPHVHAHRHVPLTHSHSHTPDLHHTHHH